MPGLDSPQFKDYKFRVSDNHYGTSVAVAGVDEFGHDDPVGSMDFYRANHESANRMQRYINDPEDFSKHYAREDVSTGQMGWRGGTMDAQHDYVGWAGMADVPGKHRLLQGLAAIGVKHHGSMPRADNLLSDDGARLARGAARKYGMQPQEANQELEGGFSYEGRDREDTVRSNARGTWSTATGRRSLEYSAADAQVAIKQMDEKYRVRPETQKAPEQTPVNPDQLRLL